MKKKAKQTSRKRAKKQIERHPEGPAMLSTRGHTAPRGTLAEGAEKRKAVQRAKDHPTRKASRAKQKAPIRSPRKPAHTVFPGDRTAKAQMARAMRETIQQRITADYQAERRRIRAREKRDLARLKARRAERAAARRRANR